MTKATEYGPPKYGAPYGPSKYGASYGPPKYGYGPPKYGYGYRPQNLQTGLGSVLKSPDIFTIVAGDTKTTTATPIELHINLTLPENGIPPTKLSLGNVAGYLNQRPGGPKPTRHTVLVDIKNQNKPFKPIPVDVFQAGLPQGSLLPPDKTADCKKLITETCKTKCSAISRGCNPLCKNASGCLATCERASKTCTAACNSVKEIELFKVKEDQKLTEQAKVVLLTKCLRHCKTNGLCISKCNDVCKDKLVEKADEYKYPSYSSSLNYRQIPGLEQLNIGSLLEGFSELNPAELTDGFADAFLPALLGILENNSDISSQGLPFNIAGSSSREADVESILNAEDERAADEDYPSSDIAVDFF